MKIRFCTTRLATTIIYILPTSIRSRAVRAMEAFADGGRFPLFTAAAAVLASFIFCFRSLFSCFLSIFSFFSCAMGLLLLKLFDTVSRTLFSLFSDSDKLSFPFCSYFFLLFITDTGVLLGKESRLSNCSFFTDTGVGGGHSVLCPFCTSFFAFLTDTGVAGNESPFGKVCDALFSFFAFLAESSAMLFSI